MSRTSLQFKRYYDRYFGKVYGFALSKVEQETVAQDIAHDVFVKILDQFSNKEKRTEAYLFTVTHNRIIDYYRALSREKTMKLALSSQGDAEPLIAPLEENGQMDAVKKAIEKLPRQRREIVQLKQFQGLTSQEIAERLAISKRTVENQFYRAMQSLRRQFQ